MKVKSFKEFDDDFVIKDFENDNNYEMIGCFKEPDFYSVAGTQDFFDEDDDPSNFNTDMDFEVFISNEKEVVNAYNKLKKYVRKNNNIDDCVVFGVFLNGDNSCLICSDYDYSYEMFLLGSLLDDIGIKRTDSNYFRDAHANREEIEEEYPTIYPTIKDYFHTKW